MTGAFLLVFAALALIVTPLVIAGSEHERNQQDELAARRRQAELAVHEMNAGYHDGKLDL